LAYGLKFKEKKSKSCLRSLKFFIVYSLDLNTVETELSIPYACLYKFLFHIFNIRVNWRKRYGCYSRLGSHFLSHDSLHTTNETEALDACISSVNYQRSVNQKNSLIKSVKVLSC